VAKVWLKMFHPAVKRIYNVGWEKTTKEDQAVARERLRALCTKDTERVCMEVSVF